LATTERFTDRNGAKQERTDWHRIVAFGQLTGTCDRFLSKGRQVYIEGRLTTRQYEAKDGSGKLTGLKLWRDNSACSATARTATRPRLKLPTTSRFSSCPRRESREKGFSFQRSKSQSEIMKMDIYAIVTEKIVNLLESGVVP
jgi:single stranded DNA-binding protein